MQKIQKVTLTFPQLLLGETYLLSGLFDCLSNTILLHTRPYLCIKSLSFRGADLADILVEHLFVCHYFHILIVFL